MKKVLLIIIIFIVAMAIPTANVYSQNIDLGISAGTTTLPSLFINTDGLFLFDDLFDEGMTLGLGVNFGLTFHNEYYEVNQNTYYISYILFPIRALVTFDFQTPNKRFGFSLIIKAGMQLVSFKHTITNPETKKFTANFSAFMGLGFKIMFNDRIGIYFNGGANIGVGQYHVYVFGIFDLGLVFRFL